EAWARNRHFGPDAFRDREALRFADHDGRRLQPPSALLAGYLEGDGSRRRDDRLALRARRRRGELALVAPDDEPIDGPAIPVPPRHPGARHGRQLSLLPRLTPAPRQPRSLALARFFLPTRTA